MTLLPIDRGCGAIFTRCAARGCTTSQTRPFPLPASLVVTSSTMKKKSARKKSAKVVGRVGGGKGVAVGVKQELNGDQKAIAKVSGYITTITGYCVPVRQCGLCG